MMLDADVAAVSPASVWRVLKQAGLLSRWKSKPSRKGTGFEQPLRPHQHWHIDVSYINLCGTFYYLCGPQFIARDFKEFIRISGMTHVRTSPNYPQSKDYASYCTSLVRPGRIWSFSDLRESLRP
jgi:putative transposase